MSLLKHGENLPKIPFYILNRVTFHAYACQVNEIVLTGLIKLIFIPLKWGRAIIFKNLFVKKAGEVVVG